MRKVHCFDCWYCRRAVTGNFMCQNRKFRKSEVFEGNSLCKPFTEYYRPYCRDINKNQDCSEFAKLNIIFRGIRHFVWDNMFGAR